MISFEAIGVKLLTREVDIREKSHRQSQFVMPKQLSALPGQVGKVPLVLLVDGIELNRIAAEEVLHAVPDGAQFAPNFPRSNGRKLPRQVQTIEAIFHQELFSAFREVIDPIFVFKLLFQN